ncbi:hypothetical protein [Abyssalbus ytuae]|uniref:Uncharacterized protein n=1 Tax=Abyssalbus ytuae TaxID=2926907 RepID=A0A9E7CUK7_9FLAO|nr:hypothetical protein [Abyssalbus ytuae]UOB18597.1 hypothetical protein MQE35_04735 [Abyssalbus ytuae]
MKYFLIKAFKNKTDDIFGIKPTDDFILFTAFGLKDLENSLKGISARGYKMRKKETLSRRLKEWGGFEIRSIFGMIMFEVKEINFKPIVKKNINYYNKSRQKNFNLKVTDLKYWKSSDN